MDSDAAELSAISSTVAELADRVVGVADRRSADPDDPLLAGLYEAERLLRTTQRRLRTSVRALG